MFQADQKDGLTAYGRLADDLWARISRGEWRPGDKLPTVLQLAEEYEVAAVTVRSALRLLSSHGLIHARQGRGTFVAKDADTPAESAADDQGGLEPNYFESWIIGPSERVQVIDKRVGVSLPAALADGAPTYDSYVQLVRLHMGGDRPVCIVDFFVADEAYASFPEAIDGQFKVGLLLMTRGIPRPARGRQIVTVETATRQDAQLLDIAPNSPLVRVRRRFLTADGRVVGGGDHRYPGSVFCQVIDEPIDEILAKLPSWLPSEGGRQD